MQNRTIALAGNPNCGKTTLFNGLTGTNQKTGNWPGVTVEKKEGILKLKDHNVNIVDLPGIYGLSAYSEDEKVTRNYLLSGEADLIINIVDSTNLERNLYLTAQIIEMGIPVLILLNMQDIARKKKIKIDAEKLSKKIKSPILSISAVDKLDMNSVKEKISELLTLNKNQSIQINYANEIEDILSKWEPALVKISKEIGASERWVGVKLLEGDMWTRNKVISKNIISESEIEKETEEIENTLKESTDVIFADYRYGFIHGIVKDTVTKNENKEFVTDKIDKFVLSRFLGIPFFLLVMYLMFWFTINVGGSFIDFFDIFFGTIFVDGFANLLSMVNSPEWLTTILAGGIGAGIQTVATFIPIIFTMFFAMSILEDSGYMSRAAFVMDRFLRTIGLPGKAFIPMIVGFGCTVPGIMATRTLENKKDRYLTIFMAPFMSCGARLPVYVLFAAAFFPKSGGMIVFSIYATGIILAVLTGLLLKNTLFKGEASYFVMELPPYHFPRTKHIFIHTWNKLKEFIFRAGKVIVLIVAIIAFLNSIGTDGSFGNEDTEKSVLAAIGKTINPLFVPLGVEEDNWPASVSLFTGIFAKEAIVGTLNSLYSQNSKDNEVEEGSSEEDEFDFFGGIDEAFSSIPEGLSGVFGSMSDPFGLSMTSETDKDIIAEEIGADRSVIDSMKDYFTPIQAYAYLLFILLYFPCVAAFGAMVGEVGRKMSWLIAIYLTLIGWIVSTLFYQILEGHSFIWIIVPLIMFSAIIFAFSKLGKSSMAINSNEE